MGVKFGLKLRKEHRLRVFENRVLRIILGTKWDKEIGEWRRLHKEELDALYCIPNIIWVIKSRMRWAQLQNYKVCYALLIK
jgi:hypothetical protein